MWKGFLNQSTEAARSALLVLGDIISHFLGLLFIVIAGWFIARIVKALIIKTLKSLRLDAIAESTGINAFLSKGGIQKTFTEVVGGLFFWLCLLITAAVAVDFLGLEVIGLLINKVILYIPNIIISIFILLLGMFFSTFLGRAVMAAASNAGLLRARLLSKIVETIILVSSVAIALEQLNIGAEIINLVVRSIIIGIAAAAALAFGLGCKDMAAEAFAYWLEKLQEKK